jgi:E3 ubiquitin-protein ligase HUWE1
LRANTEFTNGYTPESPQVRWLWQTLAAATKEDIGRFLQFVTGSSKIPLEGFKALQGMRGPQKFQITRIRDITRLP